MINSLLGTKSRMSQTFTRTGVRIPVSVVRAVPNIVTFIKTEKRDGYWAIQLSTGSKKIKNIKKPELQHLRRASKIEKRGPSFLREVRGQEPELSIGQAISAAEVFRPGDIVKVTGVSKGKGFAGVVKRWGFAGGPKTHGQSDRLRAPGSIGQGTTPGRVFKGKKMAGRMGHDTVSIRNLVVLKVDENELWLSGPVPGSRRGLLKIEKTGEDKKFIELYEKEGQPNMEDKDIPLRPDRIGASEGQAEIKEAE